MSISLNGANGQLTAYEDHLEITRRGFLARLSHWKSDDTYIDYSDIVSIKYRPGIAFVSGYLYFQRSGGDESCGLIQAARDEDCIVFRSYNNEEAREIKKFIQKQLAT